MLHLVSRSLRRRPTAGRVLLPSLSNSSSRGVWSSSAGRQWLSVLLLLHGLELVCQREGAGLEHSCGVLRRKLQLRGEEGSSSLRVRHKRGPPIWFDLELSVVVAAGTLRSRRHFASRQRARGNPEHVASVPARPAQQGASFPEGLLAAAENRGLHSHPPPRAPPLLRPALLPALLPLQVSARALPT